MEPVDRTHPRGTSSVLALLDAVPVELTDGEVTEGLADLITHIGRAQAALASLPH